MFTHPGDLIRLWWLEKRETCSYFKTLFREFFSVNCTLCCNCLDGEEFHPPRATSSHDAHTRSVQLTFLDCSLSVCCNNNLTVFFGSQQIRSKKPGKHQELDYCHREDKNDEHQTERNQKNLG